MFKKKSLGQHFLTSSSYLQAVADAADVTVGDTVLEIGPGEGALTTVLLAKGARVVAIEKDHRLVPMLHATFDKEAYNGQLEVLEADALEFDISNSPVLKTAATYKVVANIPYYITGALLRKFLTGPKQPSTLVFLVQKEVAERIARSKKESLLSLSIKAYGTPRYVKTVPRGAFTPAPDVDSAILLVSNISRDNFTNEEEEKHFFALIHAGFAQKRKLLVRNLEPVLGKSASVYLEAVGLPANSRAEDVSLIHWLALAKTPRKEI